MFNCLTIVEIGMGKRHVLISSCRGSDAFITQQEVRGEI